MKDVLSVLKSRGFSILASFSFTLTSFLAVSIYNDVKYLVGKMNQYDVKIEKLETDVERLNNTIYFEKPEPSFSGQIASLVPDDPKEDIISFSKSAFILPSPPTEIKKKGSKKK